MLCIGFTANSIHTNPNQAAPALSVRLPSNAPDCLQGTTQFQMSNLWEFKSVDCTQVQRLRGGVPAPSRIVITPRQNLRLIEVLQKLAKDYRLVLSTLVKLNSKVPRILTKNKSHTLLLKKP